MKKEVVQGVAAFLVVVAGLVFMSTQWPSDKLPPQTMGAPAIANQEIVPPNIIRQEAAVLAPEAKNALQKRLENGKPVTGAEYRQILKTATAQSSGDPAAQQFQALSAGSEKTPTTTRVGVTLLKAAVYSIF